MLIVCVALYFGSCLLAAARDQSVAEAQHFLGAVETRELVEPGENYRNTASKLYGPFDIWDGQVWRIPVTAFHHANLIHLAFNIITGWYVGQRLEQYWGRLKYVLFVLPAVFLPIMAELAIGRAVIGFSGVVSAILGALVVLREFRPEVAKAFPVAAAKFGIGAIIGFWLVTILNLDHFANATHFCGFAYGVVAALASPQAWGSQWWWKFGFGVACGLSVLGLEPVSHPIWLGKYHWYVATKAGTLAERDRSLKKAVEVDPALSGAWIAWSLLATSHGEFMVSWDRVLEGLQSNPSNVPLQDEMRRIWRHLDKDQRAEAESSLRLRFGRRAQGWLEQARADVVADGSAGVENNLNTGEPVDLREFALDRKLELPAFQELPSQVKRHAQKLPVQRNDAMEGETL